MERMGLSQTQLAEMAHIDNGALSRHLKQAHPARTDSIQKYSEALKVNPIWLAYGRGEMELESKHETDLPMVGVAALAAVLDDYEWPSGIPTSTIDAVVTEVRQQAATEAGRLRPRSVWRATIRDLIHRRHPSGSVPQFKTPDSHSIQRRKPRPTG